MQSNEYHAHSLCFIQFPSHVPIGHGVAELKMLKVSSLRQDNSATKQTPPINHETASCLLSLLQFCGNKSIWPIIP